MDIVERLRKMVGVYIGDADIDDDLNNAADEIERLREALKAYSCDCPSDDCEKFQAHCGQLARSALQQKDSE